MSAASSSVLLLQKATNKRQKQMLKDAFKVGRKLTNFLMGSSSVHAEMWASVLYIFRLQPISSFIPFRKLIKTEMENCLMRSTGMLSRCQESRNDNLEPNKHFSLTFLVSLRRSFKILLKSRMQMVMDLLAVKNFLN